MEIITERLCVRAYYDKDFKAIANLLRNSKVMHFSVNGPIHNHQAQQRYIEKYFMCHPDQSFGLCPVEILQEKKVIGFVGLIEQTLSDQTSEVELGYRLDPMFWKLGYAKEACMGMIEYARVTLRLPKLISIIDVKNLPSIFLSKRLGFELEKQQKVDGVLCAIYSKKLTG